jgi:hypothetical protein
MKTFIVSLFQSEISIHFSIGTEMRYVYFRKKTLQKIALWVWGITPVLLLIAYFGHVFD